MMAAKLRPDTARTENVCQLNAMINTDCHLRSHAKPWYYLKCVLIK